MPEVNSTTPGHFCWIELATPDEQAAKKFYTDLFGWTLNENDMGEMGMYTIFQKSGRDAGAMYKQPPDQVQQGIPPNWASYVAVASADDSAAKAQSLGGTVIMQPFDVFDFGRMAVLQDPEGAVFCVWQANKHFGVMVRDEDNTLCWNELASKDPEAALGFYGKLFGWEGKVAPEYVEVSSGGTPVGGIRRIGEGEPTPPNWMPYFAVADCDGFVASAQSGGATPYVPPRDIPSVGRFSVLGDPQGAVFAVIRLASS